MLYCPTKALWLLIFAPHCQSSKNCQDCFMTVSGKRECNCLASSALLAIVEFAQGNISVTKKWRKPEFFWELWRQIISSKITWINTICQATLSVCFCCMFIRELQERLKNCLGFCALWVSYSITNHSRDTNQKSVWNLIFRWFEEANWTVTFAVFNSFLIHIRCFRKIFVMKMKPFPKNVRSHSLEPEALVLRMKSVLQTGPILLVKKSNH